MTDLNSCKLIQRVSSKDVTKFRMNNDSESSLVNAPIANDINHVRDTKHRQVRNFSGAKKLIFLQFILIRWL